MPHPRPPGKLLHVQPPRYERPSTCVPCALHPHARGWAPPAGPSGARLNFCGEALGWDEATHGEPFIGAAGGVLSRVFHRAGISRAEVGIHNVVTCQPPRDFLVGAPWEEHAILTCRQYRDPWLAAIPDNGVVVPLGMTPLTVLLNLRGTPGVAVRDFHGTVHRDPTDRFWIIPSFHPSHLQCGAMNLLDVVTQDVLLAQRVAQQGFVRSRADLIVDPSLDWFRQWVSWAIARVTADPDGVHLSLDTEFNEKLGADESEVVRSDSVITRVNVTIVGDVGITVVYQGEYRQEIERLLAGWARASAWCWLWNKYVDWDKLRQAGHTLDGIHAVDGMWLWHYLQSDLPRGLGFVAPMASDFGAWKHWGKDRAREGPYAAADALQNYRTCMWLLKDATQLGMIDVFLRDWHERDQYVLRPATVQGTPVNRLALEAFHQELQAKLAGVLVKIKEVGAQGVLKPKLGYAKRPKGKVCPGCKDSPVAGTVWIKQFIDDGMGTETVCESCNGAGELPPLPPKSILGAPKKGGAEAKTLYMQEGVRLVEKDIEVEVRCCETCGMEGVGSKHRCKSPKPPRRKKGDAVDRAPRSRPVADVRPRRILQRRYFWQLPFNPDAPAQILAYLASRDIAAPVDKKKDRPTTSKAALEALRNQHEDPFFQLQLDWKAVQKVDSTYAVGTMNRLDEDDRVHPEFTCKPSTLRDSCTGPNLQNVVADKGGPAGLASGFRRVIEARDGIPSNRTPAELAAWEAKWG